MKKILVTGANGQLGQCIQKIDGQYATLEFVFKDSKQLDITDSEKINFLFKKINFDFCINCAAYTNVEQAEKTSEIAYSVNAEGAKNLALACKENRVCLIHISTDYVFDGKKETGYLPYDTTNPINEYGKSKLKGEQYIQDTLEHYFIIRTSWLYSEFGKNFYKTILEKSKTDDKLFITDDEKGCPTNANNLVKFIIEKIILKDIKFGICHFTDGEAMTWYDFAKKILIDNNLDDTIRLVMDKNYRSFVKRPTNSVLLSFKNS